LRKAMGKRPSKDSFTSTSGKRVIATPLASMWAQLLHPARRKIYVVLEKENEHEPAPLASNQVSHLVFE
jgi:hypothetical protein